MSDSMMSSKQDLQDRVLNLDRENGELEERIVELEAACTENYSALVEAKALIVPGCCTALSVNEIQNLVIKAVRAGNTGSQILEELSNAEQRAEAAEAELKEFWSELEFYTNKAKQAEAENAQLREALKAWQDVEMTDWWIQTIEDRMHARALTETALTPPQEDAKP